MKRFASDAGVALVEFALVAPVLIFLLVGILDVARGVNAYVTLSNAAREGARYAALHPSAAPSAIASTVKTRIAPLEPAETTVTAYYWDGATLRPWPSSGVPASAGGPQYVSTQVRVSYPWDAVTLLIGAFFSSSPLQASSTMETVR